MKIWILALSFIFTAPGLKAQFGEIKWEKEFICPGNTAFADAIAESNGGFSILGYFEKPRSSEKDFWFLRLDKNGDTLFTKKYKVPENCLPRRLCQVPSGGYIIYGEIATDSLRSRPYLLFTDKNGDLCWQNEFIYGNFETCADMVITDKFNVAFTGTIYNGTQKNIWMAKMNGRGELLWEKMYGGKYEAQGVSIKMLPDGGFVVGAIANEPGRKDHSIWILRTDNKGDTLWTSMINSEGNKLYPGCICCTPDSCMNVAGWKGIPLNDLYSEAPILDYNLELCKIGRDGKIIWEKNIDKDGSEAGNNMIQLKDETFIVAGRIENSLTGKVGSWILHIDKNGNILGEVLKRPRFNNDQAYKIIATSDGGFAVIGPGPVIPENSQNFGWIIRFKPF